MITRRLTLAAFALALVASPALAQNAEENTPQELPAICTKAAEGMAMNTPQPAEHMGMLDEAHQELIGTMTPMHSAMMGGMMAEDIDVAFVCGMIPHHQGAIDMARVELERGDDPWAKEMAQKVIDAQEQEIADMRAWLERQPQ